MNTITLTVPEGAVITVHLADGQVVQFSTKVESRRQPERQPEDLQDLQSWIGDVREQVEAEKPAESGFAKAEASPPRARSRKKRSKEVQGRLLDALHQRADDAGIAQVKSKEFAAILGIPSNTLGQHIRALAGQKKIQILGREVKKDGVRTVLQFPKSQPVPKSQPAVPPESAKVSAADKAELILLAFEEAVQPDGCFDIGIRRLIEVTGLKSYDLPMTLRSLERSGRIADLVRMDRRRYSAETGKRIRDTQLRGRLEKQSPSHVPIPEEEPSPERNDDEKPTPRVRSKCFLIVGGYPERGRKERLRRKLGADIVWIGAAGGATKLRSVVDRIQTFDGVVMISGHMPHSQWEPVLAACRKYKIPCSVNTGGQSIDTILTSLGSDE